MIGKLLLNTEGANPRSVIPKKSVGLSWQQFQIAIAKSGLRANPLALIHNGEPETCPQPDTKIEGTDRILIAVYDTEEWDNLEEKIVIE